MEEADENLIRSPAPGFGERRVLGVQFLRPGGDAGSATQGSIPFTCVPSSRSKTSSISRSGRPKWECHGLWDRFTFRSTCGERFGDDSLRFLGSNPSTSTPPNPRPKLTVQAAFKENLFCLKDTRMRVTGQSLRAPVIVPVMGAAARQAYHMTDDN